MRFSAPLAVCLLLFAGCERSPAPAARDVPPLPIGLERAEATIRDDLRDHHDQLAAAAAEPGTTPSALAGRFGELGVSLLAHGFFEEAAESLRRAIELAPAEFRWHYYLGQAVRRTGDMAAAADAFARALTTDEHNLAATLWLAETRLAREELDAAEQGFRRGLELERYCGQAWTGLGRIALSRGRYAEALEHLERALEQRPESARARYSLALTLRGLGRLDEARQQLERLEGENHSLILTCFEDPWMREVRRRQTGTRAHEERAVQAIEERHLATALVELRAAVRANPNRFPARYDIATILMQMGRFDEAREELETLLEARPDYAAALSLLAVLEARDGRASVADALLERAVAADPRSESVRLDRARIHHAAGRTQSALESYERALEISPTLVPAILGRDACLAASGRRDEALEDLERRAVELPSRPSIGLLRAHLLLAGRRPADTERALELAGEIATRHPTVAAGLTLAAALARSGRHDEAAAWGSRALAALPEDPSWARTRRRAEALRAGRPANDSFDPETLALLMLDTPLPTHDPEETP